MREQESYRIVVGVDDDGPAKIIEFIEGWLKRPGLQRLVELAGGRWPTDGDLITRLETLYEFSERWDFRRGGERLQIDPASPAGIASGDVMECAVGLGMASATAPRDQSYRHAVVLGGTALANIYRLRYLHSLMLDGLRIGHVAALTALRTLQPAELDVVSERSELVHLVRGATTEFDVFVAAASELFDQRSDIAYQDHENSNLRGARAELGSLSVLAAPSSDPGRRANTKDNYAAYLNDIHDGDAVLVVTSSIYCPYQFFVGVEALGVHRAGTVEAIGFPPEWMRGVLTGPTNVLQELRSAFFGALSLARAAGS